MRALLYTCCLCLAFLGAGCAQRINAQVSAFVEEGYVPAGQSFQLCLLPGFASNDAALLPALEEQLRPALLAMGYVLPPPAQAARPPEPAEPAASESLAAAEPAHIDVRLYWYSTGPHHIYRLSPFDDDFRFHRRRYGRYHRAVIMEELYDRVFVVEALLNPPATQNHRVASPVSPREAVHYLPAPPARILWRVIVESRGNLANTERVLEEMAAAALPWLGKAALVRVTVQGGAIVNQSMQEVR